MIGNRIVTRGSLLLIFAACAGCATTEIRPEQAEAPVTQMQQAKAQKAVATPTIKRYKRKIAVIRFTNETNYGKALMTDDELREMVRASIARLAVLSTEGAPVRGMPHASFAKLPVLRGGDDDGACLIEPAVRCNHCGYCKSVGH